MIRFALLYLFVTPTQAGDTILDMEQWLTQTLCPSSQKRGLRTAITTSTPHVGVRSDTYVITSGKASIDGRTIFFPELEYVPLEEAEGAVARAERLMGLRFGQPLGVGASKVVFPHPTDANLVVKIFDPDLTRGRYRHTEHALPLTGNKPIKEIGITAWLRQERGKYEKQLGKARRSPGDVLIFMQRDVALESFLPRVGIPIARYDRSQKELWKYGIILQGRASRDSIAPYFYGAEPEIDRYLNRIRAIDEEVRLVISKRYEGFFIANKILDRPPTTGTLDEALSKIPVQPMGIDLGAQHGNIHFKKPVRKKKKKRPRLVDW